jgi:hypothetical protein
MAPGGAATPMGRASTRAMDSHGYLRAGRKVMSRVGCVPATPIFEHYFLVMSFPQHWSGTLQVPPPPEPQLQAFET